MIRRWSVVYVLIFLMFAVQVIASPISSPRTYNELVQLSADDLQLVDIARMNLLCAEGLSGAENLNIEVCLKKLGVWAKYVSAMDRKYVPAFQQNRSKYRDSLALFKGVYLGIAIEQDFGCGYNQSLLDSGAMDDRSSTRFFKDASDVFIHGLLEDGNGSCSSLPVLMVALGRRCEYPMYLVGCGGHAFARWDDDKERVNLEITCKGVNSYDDDHYREWPRFISSQEITQECLLRNYTPNQMLGVFVSLRAECLKEHGRYAEAKECYEVALQHFPASKRLLLCIQNMDRRMRVGE